MDVKTKNNNVILKIDMTKAYNRLSWCFLTKMLKAFGFSDQWCELVKRTIESCQFGVIVNGSVAGFFKASHWLRQGDPLSPALFIIASEFLSRGLNELFSKHPELFYDSKKTVKVSHLAYAGPYLVH